jgi:CBS domain-containing protein
MKALLLGLGGPINLRGCMIMKYNVIEIFTSEEAHWKGRPVPEMVIEAVQKTKISARCMVTKGVAGCYENGEVASHHIEILSFNMPIKIEIILPAAELESVLPALEEIVTEGTLAVEEMDLRVHRTKKRLIPRQIKVRDAMTPNPKSVRASTPASDVIRLLLSSEFHSVPVVNEKNRPIGIITQDDLIRRAGMPVRLGLVSMFEQKKVEDFLNSIAHKTAEEIMTKPVITVTVEKRLSEAVDMMLNNKLKRFPVVDAEDVLVGMLARYDILHTITKESPDWKAIQARKVVVDNVRVVRDIMQRDTHTVLPEASVQEVVEIIDANDIQRVAVVDKEGRFQGMIFDHDVLGYFSEHHPGLWDHLAAKLPFTEMARQHAEKISRTKARTAAELMKTDVIRVQEETRIDEAVKLMSGKNIKRLPVLDAEGRFKGMVSRDSILRAGVIS